MKRARHNLLKRFLLTIWMVVGIIFSINAQYPDNFDISQDLKFDYDECTGRLTIDFRVYYYGGVDDYMKNASVYANIPGQGNTEILYYSGSSNYNNHCWYQRGGYNFNITTNCSGAWYSSGPGDSRWVKVEWLDYPQSILDAGQFDMVFDYSWDGNYDDFNNDGNTKTVNITRPDVPTGLTATTNDCNNVILNWDESSFTCASQSSFSPYYQIRRKVQGSAGLSSSLSYIPHGTTTYTDTGASSGTTYEYSIRFERDYTNGVNTSLFSNESSPVIGKRKETPPIPLNLMASDDNCDGTIDLTWDVPFGTNADGYVISYAGNTSGTINVVGGNTSSTVHSGVLNDNVYTYTIAAMNDCGSSSASASETGISLGSPISVTLSTPIVDPVNQTVQLDWNDVVNELEYKVVRTFAGGGGMVQTNVGQNITTFTDTDVNPCIEYRYQVFTLNSCSSTGAVSNNTMNVTLPIDLTQVFDNTKKLDASKGYYPDRVELTWDNNQGQDLSSFRISRKASGSTSAYALIATVNPSSAIYIDNSISANIIYDYKIEGVTQCDDGVVLSNASLAKGFRSPAGIISGQITYSGGVAVEGVRVLVESTDNAGNYGGSSVYLTGLSDELTIPHSSTLDQSMGFTMEMWIKPSNWANDFTLIKKIDNNDGLIVEKIGSNVIVKMGDGSG
ncbi:MAG: fibronectin type III domain-containing protein, partial [Saprospiraceae bacterium]